MSGPAHVHSIEAIEHFRAALARFEQRAQDALETLGAELRRATDWVEHDRPAYWREQTRLANDKVHQAKIDLERCLMLPVADERPSCREERGKLKKAQQRVDYCHDKSDRVRHWNRQLQHELFEYEGRVGHLKRLVEVEIPAAQAKLKQILRRLEGYQIERAPTSEQLTLRVKEDKTFKEN